MAVSFDQYVRDAFRTYLREHGTSLAEIARESVASGRHYNQCQDVFRDNVIDYARDFQKVIGQYMADDVVIAVGDVELEDFVDVDDLFSDDWIAYSTRSGSGNRTATKRAAPGTSRPKSASKSKSTRSTKPKTKGARS